MDRAKDQLAPVSPRGGAGAAGDPDALATDIERSRQRIDTLVDAIAERARRSSVGATLETVRHVQDRMADAGAEAAARWERARSAVVRIPSQRPLTMVLTAAAVGFVLGLMVPRRH